MTTRAVVADTRALSMPLRDSSSTQTTSPSSIDSAEELRAASVTASSGRRGSPRPYQIHTVRGQSLRTSITRTSVGAGCSSVSACRLYKKTPTAANPATRPAATAMRRMLIPRNRTEALPTPGGRTCVRHRAGSVSSGHCDRLSIAGCRPRSSDRPRWSRKTRRTGIAGQSGLGPAPRAA